jgi:hypothetical protein
MQSTEQVPDAHQALPWWVSTSPRSGATSPGTGPGLQPRVGGQTATHLTLRLPNARSNVPAEASAVLTGPGTLLAVRAVRAVRWKKQRPAIRGLIDRPGSGNSRMRGIWESVVISRMLLRTLAAAPASKFAAHTGIRIFSLYAVATSTSAPGTKGTVNRDRRILAAAACTAPLNRRPHHLADDQGSQLA